MSDKINVTLEAGTPEAVAFQLMEKIAELEGGSQTNGNPEHIKREYWLSLFAECLKATRSQGTSE